MTEQGGVKPVVIYVERGTAALAIEHALQSLPFPVRIKRWTRTSPGQYLAPVTPHIPRHSKDGP